MFEFVVLELLLIGLFFCFFWLVCVGFRLNYLLLLLSSCSSPDLQAK